MYVNRFLVVWDKVFFLRVCVCVRAALPTRRQAAGPWRLHLAASRREASRQKEAGTSREETREESDNAALFAIFNVRLGTRCQSDRVRVCVSVRECVHTLVGRCEKDRYIK